MSKDAALFDALERGDDADAVVLLEGGADAKAFLRGRGFAIDAAVRGGCVAALRALVERGVDPQEGLRTAVRLSKPKAVTVLMQLGATAEPDGSFLPLAHAAMEGDVGVARALLAAGARPDHTDGRLGTPLHLAVSRPDDHPRLVRLLVEYGADLEATDFYTKGTPLLTALHHSNGASAQLLLDLGANAKARAKDRTTALHTAAMRGLGAVVTRLLAAKIKVDTTNRNKETPLLCAARHQMHRVALQLLEAGADPNKADKYGTTPRSWLERSQNPTVLDALAL